MKLTLVLTSLLHLVSVVVSFQFHQFLTKCIPHRTLRGSRNNDLFQIFSLWSSPIRIESAESSIAQGDTAAATAATAPTAFSLTEATAILQKFDDEVSRFAEEENIGMGGGVSASMYYTTLPEEALVQIAQAVSVLVSQANQEREEEYTIGRVKLGICADNCMEALGTLKSWVSTLKLPRGLLHGMDVDGVPIDTSSFGPAFIKYNTGGAVTFSEIRRTGLGFDDLWKPGDAVLEGYDGDFRGVYINVELRDGVFRQYGILPLDLFGR